MTASTPPWPRLRNVGSVQLMTQLGTELGLTVPQCLAQTGLDVMALADGQAQVQAAQELQVVSNLLAGLPEQPLLGLLAGRRYQLGVESRAAPAPLSALPSPAPPSESS